MFNTIHVRTKSGSIFKVWSDNVDEQDLNVYPADENFDAEATTTTLIKYNEVAIKGSLSEVSV